MRLTEIPMVIYLIAGCICSLAVFIGSWFTPPQEHTQWLVCFVAFHALVGTACIITLWSREVDARGKR